MTKDAVAALAYSPARYKLIAMALSAAIVGAGGCFLCAICPFHRSAKRTRELRLSVRIALIAIFGGVGTVAGPIVGAVVLVPISEYSRVWFSGSGRNVRPAHLRLRDHGSRRSIARTA